MYNKQHFIQNLKDMGLKQTDTVFVHSSYKKISGDIGIDGGADTIIDAFLEYFGEKGLAIFPAMSWKLGWLINEQGDLRNPSLGPADGFFEFGSNFNVYTTPCADNLGIIPELFRQRPGVIRSLNPTSSVAAFGPDAKSFCAGHEKSETPLNWNSPFGKLYERRAKILFLGTTLVCNTFMHALEEYAGVPGILAPYIWKYTVTDYDGNTFPVSFKRHVPFHDHYYNKVESEFIEHDIAKTAMFGSAETHIVDAVAETEYMLKLGGLEYKVNANVKVYISWTYQYLELRIDNILKFDLSVSAEV